MQWNSVAEFLDMGGYAFYVWGSFGITALVAVSAPTALAVELAKSAGLLLVGFARTGQRVVYSQPDRLDLQPSAASHSLM